MTDIVVMGAGIVGSSAAYHAAKAGARVTLVEPGLPGRATTAGAGIISPVGLDRGEVRGPWVELVAECVDAYEALVAEIESDLGTDSGRSGFARHGELVIAEDDADRQKLEELEAWVHARGRIGGRATAQRLATAEVQDFFPLLREGIDAVFIPEVGRVDGNRFAAMLLEAAQRTGRVEVVSARGELDVSGARPRVSADGRDLTADAIVVATGAWSADVLQQLGVSLGIKPNAGEIMHLRPADVPTAGLPVVNTFSGSYFVPFDDRIAAGATHEHRPDRNANTTAGGQRSVLEQALRLAPGLDRATVLETRVGLRPTSEDGLPLVGATAVDGVVLASGLGSWGLTLGPTLGGVAARVALGEPAEPRYGPLSPLRNAIPREESGAEAEDLALSQTGGS
jgi:D-amino-acid dehydrogenase